MGRHLDVDTWARREHFQFFRGFDQPFWNVTVSVDVTEVYEYCREVGLSFSLVYLYQSIRAANETEPFRYRLRGDRVFVHDRVHPGTTVMRDDETFGFGYFEYGVGFRRFHAEGRAELDRVRGGVELHPGGDRDDMVYYSVLPWLAFTSFSHARTRNPDDSIPRLVFGKHQVIGGRRTMPVSVEVHHALMDGLHVGRFVDRFQALLDDPETLQD
ncbi:MAG: chloramphenicol acetyltransferase [Acidobacteriota bacterium]